MYLLFWEILGYINFLKNPFFNAHLALISILYTFLCYRNHTCTLLVYNKRNSSRQINQKYGGNGYRNFLQVRSMLSKTH